MKSSDIVQKRLINQHLAFAVFKAPADLVHYMGAIQAQDYAGAKWAIAQRLLGATDVLIEKAFTDGDIIRTHLMRPTWHLVSPIDIRWMLELTAPRVLAAISFRQRYLKLDHQIFSRCEKALTNTLRERKQLPRDEIAIALQQAGIATDEQRFIHIMMQMEAIGLVCSGARQGKQFTYTLLDERVPLTKQIDRQDGLSMLTERYFVAHGPATLQDFVWWSGLTVADAKTGLEMVKHKLVNEIADGNTYWSGERTTDINGKVPSALLLPNYDEYIVSYKDRGAVIHDKDIDKADPRGTIFNNTIIINGRIVGTWKRNLKKEVVILEITPFAPLSKSSHKAIEAAANRYTKYLGMKHFEIQL